MTIPLRFDIKLLGLDKYERINLIKSKKMTDAQLKQIFSQWDYQNFIDLLNNIYEAVCIIDRDLRILLWNKALETLSGNDAETLINKKCKKNILIQGPGEKLLPCAEMCPWYRALKIKCQGPIKSISSTEKVLGYPLI